MKIMDRFKELVLRGRRHGPDFEPGPFEGAPDVTEGDAVFIAGVMRTAKWEGVEFYGPGAAAAEARRAARLNPEPAAAAAVENSHDEKKRGRLLSKRGRLEKKMADLRAEISGLKK